MMMKYFFKKNIKRVKVVMQLLVVELFLPPVLLMHG
jgi:hypothetical protein